MADELTKMKVREDLRNDIDYYDREIGKKVGNVENMNDEVEIENLRRQRDGRKIDLNNIK